MANCWGRLARNITLEELKQYNLVEFLREHYGLECQRVGSAYERSQRPTKVLPEEVVALATDVIAMFPHFGGTKGQAYMLYHQLGLIGQKSFDRLKKMVEGCSSRKLPDATIAQPVGNPMNISGQATSRRYGWKISRKWLSIRKLLRLLY